MVKEIRRRIKRLMGIPYSHITPDEAGKNKLFTEALAQQMTHNLVNVSFQTMVCECDIIKTINPPKIYHELIPEEIDICKNTTHYKIRVTSKSSGEEFLWLCKTCANHPYYNGE